MNKYFTATLSLLIMSITNTYAGFYELDWGMPDDDRQMGYVYGETTYVDKAGVEHSLDPNLIYSVDSYGSYTQIQIEQPWLGGGGYMCFNDCNTSFSDDSEAGQNLRHFIENSYAYNCGEPPAGVWSTWQTACNMDNNYTENLGGRFLGFRDDPSSQIEEAPKNKGKRIYTIEEANTVAGKKNTLKIRYK